MTAVLDHTIAPVRDQDESGDFYTNVLGFKYDGRTGMNDVFAVIRLNDSSTLDLWRSDEIPGLSHHYALALDRTHFDRFFQAIQDSGIPLWRRAQRSGQHTRPRRQRWRQGRNSVGLFQRPQRASPCVHRLRIEAGRHAASSDKWHRQPLVENRWRRFHH